MAEAGEKVETVTALWRSAEERDWGRAQGRDSGTVGQCPSRGAEAKQALRGAGPAGTAWLHRGGGGKMEAAEPGSGREGGFRSAPDAAMEPRAVSLPRDMRDMTKFISTREFFSETKLEDFGAVPLIGCSP